MNLFEVLVKLWEIYFPDEVEFLKEYLERGNLQDEKLDYKGLTFKTGEDVKDAIQVDPGFLYYLLSRVAKQGNEKLHSEIIDCFIPFFIKKFNKSDVCLYEPQNTFDQGYGYLCRLIVPKMHHFSIKTEAQPSPDKGWKIHLSIAEDSGNLGRALPIVLRLFFKYQLPHLKIKNLAIVPIDRECAPYEQGKQVTFYFGNNITPYKVSQLTKFIRELTIELAEAKIQSSTYGENVRYVTPYVGYKNDSGDITFNIIPSADEIIPSLMVFEDSSSERSQEKESKYRPPEEPGYKLDKQSDPFESAFTSFVKEFNFNPIHKETAGELFIPKVEDKERKNRPSEIGKKTLSPLIKEKKATTTTHKFPPLNLRSLEQKPATPSTEVSKIDIEMKGQKTSRKEKKSITSPTASKTHTKTAEQRGQKEKKLKTTTTTPKLPPLNLQQLTSEQKPTTTSQSKAHTKTEGQKTSRKEKKSTTSIAASKTRTKTAEQKTGQREKKLKTTTTTPKLPPLNLQPLASEQKPTTTSQTAPKAHTEIKGQKTSRKEKKSTTSSKALKTRTQIEGEKTSQKEEKKSKTPATHKLSSPAKEQKGHYQPTFFKTEETESILSPRVSSKRPQEKTARTKSPTSKEAEKNLPSRRPGSDGNSSSS